MCIEPSCRYPAIYGHKTFEGWQRTKRRSKPMLMRCFCGSVGDCELKVAHDARAIFNWTRCSVEINCRTNAIRRRSTAPAELHRLPETRRMVRPESGCLLRSHRYSGNGESDPCHRASAA